jgi:hypothetical protein
MLSRSARIFSAVIALVCLAVLVTAYLLEPSARGMGSHTRLGLPACGWLAMFGKPCITCGYTTTFAWTAKGEFVTAIRNQPAAFAAVTGARIDRVVSATFRPWVLWTMGGVVVAAWMYKVAMHT